MKILLAFALVASVAALVPNPVELGDAPAPEFVGQEARLLPLIMPKAINDFEQQSEVEVDPVQFADSENFVHPLAYGAAPEEFQAEPVQFADSADFVHPLAYGELPEEFHGDAENFVHPLAYGELPEEFHGDAENFVHPLAYAAESEAIEVPAVSFVEPEVAAEEVVNAEEAVDAEEAVNVEEIVASPVLFVDIGEVAEAPVAEDIAAVNFVDIAEDAAVPEPISFEAFAQEIPEQNDTPQEFPYENRYDNAMLR